MYSFVATASCSVNVPFVYASLALLAASRSTQKSLEAKSAINTDFRNLTFKVNHTMIMLSVLLKYVILKCRSYLIRLFTLSIWMVKFTFNVSV